MESVCMGKTQNVTQAIKGEDGNMSKLTVLECDYVYNAWRVKLDGGKESFISEVKEYTQRKATDDFELCGVYHKAGLPYEIKKITDRQYPELEAYQAVPRMFSDEVCEAVKNGNKVLTSSGYCVYAPAILGGIQRAIGDDKTIGVVWMDAHADNVIIEDTSQKTVTLVAVPLSTLLGQTMESWRIIHCGLKNAIDSKNVLISDVRSSNSECIRNLTRTEVIWLKEEEFDDAERWDAAVKQLAERVDAIYLMLDADILSPSYIPAYFRTEPGGHSIETLMRNVESVMQTGKVLAFSTFCFDFDKYEQGGETTYLNAMRIIGAGLSSWRTRALHA